MAWPSGDDRPSALPKENASPAPPTTPRLADGLIRRDGLCRFLEDGRIEIDSDSAARGGRGEPAGRNLDRG